MIRDLQARSWCRIDVRQDMGDAGRSAEDVILARELVRILCCDRGEDCDNGGQQRRRRRSLHLGHATSRSVRVPQELVGRIIGRDGETIRNMHGRSGARIQVDHDDDDAEEEEDRGIVVARGTTRRVTIIGTEEGMAAAMEMVLYLARNSGADGRLCALVGRDGVRRGMGRRSEGRKAVAGGYATATMASTPDIRTLATVGNSRRSISNHRRRGTPRQ